MDGLSALTLEPLEQIDCKLLMTSGVLCQVQPMEYTDVA